MAAAKSRELGSITPMYSPELFLVFLLIQRLRKRARIKSWKLPGFFHFGVVHSENILPNGRFFA